MRVVVTRPDHSARRTAERLEALGHQPVLLPLARPVHDPAAIADGVAQPHSAIVVTSAEAIRAIVAATPTHAVVGHQPLYAVGDATADAARQAGFRDIRTGPGTGEGLARFIGGDLTDVSQPLLYVAGNPRSPDLEDCLQETGIAMITVEVYRMVPVIHDDDSIRRALLVPKADAVMLYSRQSALALFDSAAAHLEKIAAPQFLCLSENVAAAIPAIFHGNIRIAEKPDEDGLFALL